MVCTLSYFGIQNLTGILLQIQYLDLDLESHQGPPSSPKGSKSSGGMSKLVAAEASVVYKKVDFVKTEAFNQMRQNVEASYRTGKTNN